MQRDLPGRYAKAYGLPFPGPGRISGRLNRDDALIFPVVCPKVDPMKKGLRAVILAAAVLGLRIPAGTEIAYPWKEAYIGALDAAGWCGLVLAPHKDAAFAFRFQVEKNGQIVDGHDFFYLVSEIGPNSPDGLYARIGFDLGLPILPDKKSETPILRKPSRRADLLLLEWSRQDEKAVVGRLTFPKNVSIRLLQYFPWDFKGRYRVSPGGEIVGESAGPKPVTSVLWTQRPGTPALSADGIEAVLPFLPEKDRTVYFAAGVGDSLEAVNRRLYRYKNPRTIEVLLAEERARYEKKRVLVEGPSAGAAEAITNALHWMMLYQPGAHRLYTPAGRKWIFDRPDGEPDHWQIFAWDSFLNGVELSLESSRYAADAIRAVLQTQYPNGNIPNWRSRFGGTPDRSQPPIGSYCVLKVFGKTGDRGLLEFAYPFLRRWHAFWLEPSGEGRKRRDGNNDGLLEWGSDKDLVAEKTPVWETDASPELRAKWESGQDDLPNWDDVPADPASGSQTLNSVDLNSLYALDAWCLSQIADILDRRAEHDAYLKEYETMRTLINTFLWNSREGFYFDRFWDGRFSKRKAASNFYPLLARIPDDRRAQLVRKHLLNPKEFWGDFVIPTISRDDPAFNDPANPSRQYWRGTIWPPTNYLVYQGLKAYGFDAEASEFARMSADLFLSTWRHFQLSPENFHPLSGEAAGQRHQSWGPLFALLAVEEFLDFTPWEGFRFGSISPESEGLLSRVAIQGRHYDMSVSRKKIILQEEGRPIIILDGGAVIRHFLYSENEVSFEIKTMTERQVRVYFIRKGKYQLLIDNAPKRVFTGSKVKFEVPDGNHAVLLQLLEARD